VFRENVSGLAERQETLRDAFKEELQRLREQGVEVPD